MPLSQISRVGNFIEAESRLELPGTGKGQEKSRKLLVNWYRASIWDDEKVLEIVVMIVEHREYI